MAKKAAKKAAPAPGTTDFSTPPGSAHDSDGNNAMTNGLRGLRTVFADGSEVIDATERIEAHYDGRDYGPATARQTRTKKDGVTRVHQENYAWKGRALPDVKLTYRADGLTDDVQFEGRATKFGKNDPVDSGAGSPVYKIVQTCSEVYGVSLKQSMMREVLGPEWKTDVRRLTAVVEVYHPATRRLARAPIVEVGPGNPDALIDLTWALDIFLGTNGSANVKFRIIV